MSSGPGAAEGGARKSRVTFVTLLQALKRRWLLGTIIGLTLAAMTAVGIWLFLPPADPVAYARVYMPERTKGTLSDHPDPPLHRQTQIAIVKDLLFMVSVVRRPEVVKLPVIREQENPEEWLLREMRVEFPFGPELMQFSLAGDRPQELKIIVNAVRDEYLNNYADTTRKERQDRLKRLEDNDLKIRSQIDALREQLKKIADSGQNPNKDAIVNSHKYTLDLLELNLRELMRVQSDHRQYEIELKLLNEENGQSFNPDGRLMDEYLNEHPALDELKHRRAKLQSDLEHLRKHAPQSRQASTAKADLDDVEKQLEAKKAELRPKLAGEFKARMMASREGGISKVKHKLKELSESAERLKKEIVELERQKREINKSTVTIEEIQDRIKFFETVRSGMQTTIEQVKAELEVARPRPEAQ